MLLSNLTDNQNKPKYNIAQHNQYNKIHYYIILHYYRASDRIMKTIIIIVTTTIMIN